MQPRLIGSVVISEYQAMAIGDIWADAHGVERRLVEQTAQQWFKETGARSRYRDDLEALLARRFAE